MEERNCNFEVRKNIEKIENRYDKFFIRWQKTFAKEKSKQETRKLIKKC